MTEIGIGLCTLGERKRLLSCVRSLLEQNHKAKRIVVVAGADSGPVVSQLLGAYKKEITIINFPHRNLAEARNLAVKEMQDCEFVAFIDDDAIADPDWLHYLVDSFADPDVGCVGGWLLDKSGINYQFEFQEINVFGRGRSASIGYSREIQSWMPSPIGCNFAVRFEAWASIGGFDQVFKFFHEEIDLAVRLLRANWEISINPKAVVQHFEDNSDLRSQDDIPRSLIQKYVSIGYFQMRQTLTEGINASHLVSDLTQQVALTQNWLKHRVDEGRLDYQDAKLLENDMLIGISVGMRLGITASIGDASNGIAPSQNLQHIVKYHNTASPRSRKQHVVFVCREEFGENSNGGISRWMYSLANRLSESGDISVSVITQTLTRDNSIEVLNSGVKVHRLGSNSPDGRTPYVFSNFTGGGTYQSNVGYFVSQLIEYLDRLARHDSFDWIVCPVWEGIGAGLPKSWPVLVTMHTMLEQIEDQGKLNKKEVETWYFPRIKTEQLSIKRARSVIANSTASLERARNLRVGNPNDISLIPHSVDVPKDFLDNRIRRQDRKNSILFIGRHEERKGFDLLLLAWEKISRTNENLNLIIIGAEKEGPFAGIFNSLSKNVRSTIEFTGKIDEVQKFKLLSESLAVIYPSRYESFGLVAIEAMAFGTPILAAERGGLSDVLHKYPIRLNELNPEEICKGTLDLVSNPELWMKASELGISIYESKYHPTNEVKSFISFFEKGV
jgi:hypothetical protein